MAKIIATAALVLLPTIASGCKSLLIDTPVENPRRDTFDSEWNGADSENPQKTAQQICGTIRTRAKDRLGEDEAAGIILSIPGVGLSTIGLALAARTGHSDEWVGEWTGVAAAGTALLAAGIYFLAHAGDDRNAYWSANSAIAQMRSSYNSTAIVQQDKVATVYLSHPLIADMDWTACATALKAIGSGESQVDSALAGAFKGGSSGSGGGAVSGSGAPAGGGGGNSGGGTGPGITPVVVPLDPGAAPKAAEKMASIAAGSAGLVQPLTEAEKSERPGRKIYYKVAVADRSEESKEVREQLSSLFEDGHQVGLGQETSDAIKVALKAPAVCKKDSARPGPGVARGMLAAAQTKCSASLGEDGRPNPAKVGIWWWDGGIFLWDGGTGECTCDLR
jgi:hypothetical protein